jgi:hypothetical protein
MCGKIKICLEEFKKILGALYKKSKIVMLGFIARNDKKSTIILFSSKLTRKKEASSS